MKVFQSGQPLDKSVSTDAIDYLMKLCARKA